MTAPRRPLAAAVLAALLAAPLTACKRGGDALDPFRQQCAELQDAGALKAGLALDACAKELKAAAEENDPARRAGQLADRMQGLARQASDKAGPGSAASTEELRAVIAEAAALGRSAAPVFQARLDKTRDPDLRIAYARTLVSLCFDDCALQKFDCIVPALLEGVGKDKPDEVRQVSVQGLARCTGKNLGDDPDAWTTWWAGVKGQR